jgi:hypothetical protein
MVFDILMEAQVNPVAEERFSAHPRDHPSGIN